MSALEVRTLAPLMAVRALPVAVRHPRAFAGRVAGRLRASRSRPVFEEFRDFGFIQLGEVPGSQLAFGAIGRSPQTMAKPESQMRTLQQFVVAGGEPRVELV